MTMTTRKRKTTHPPGTVVRSYTMRNMRIEYLDRLRITMAQHQTGTLEQEVLIVLAKGLRVREAEVAPAPGSGGAKDLRGGYKRS
jgi:hypothetical protein